MLVLLAFAVSCGENNNDPNNADENTSSVKPAGGINGTSTITTIPSGKPNAGQVLRTVASADGKTVTVSIESATRNVIDGEYVLELSEGNNLLYKHKTANAYVAFKLVDNKLQVVNNTFTGITSANKDSINWDLSTESTYTPDDEYIQLVGGKTFKSGELWLGIFDTGGNVPLDEMAIFEIKISKYANMGEYSIEILSGNGVFPPGNIPEIYSYDKENMCVVYSSNDFFYGAYFDKNTGKMFAVYEENFLKGFQNPNDIPWQTGERFEMTETP